VAARRAEKRDQKEQDAEVGRAFEWLLDPLKQIERNPVATLRQPSTVMARLGEQIERRLVDGGATRIAKLICSLLAKLSDQELHSGVLELSTRHANERRRMARTPTGRQFLGLVDAAHARVPYSPLLANCDPVAHSQAVLSAMGRIYDASRARGEARVRLLLVAAADAADPLYRMYLDGLWKLTHFAEGKNPRTPGSTGTLVRALSARLSEQPLIIEPDAAHVRNAAVHGHWVFDPRSKVVVLHDSNGRWRREMTSAALMKHTTKLMVCARDLYPRGVLAHFQAALVPLALPFARELSRAFLVDDWDRIKVIATEMGRHMTGLLSEAAALRTGAPG
jgi:hypothetical protein